MACPVTRYLTRCCLPMGARSWSIAGWVPLSASRREPPKAAWIGPWARYPAADWTHCRPGISLDIRRRIETRPGRGSRASDHGRPVGALARRRNASVIVECDEPLGYVRDWHPTGLARAAIAYAVQWWGFACWQSAVCASQLNGLQVCAMIRPAHSRWHALLRSRWCCCAADCSRAAVLVFALYYGGTGVAGQTNHGTLIQPPSLADHRQCGGAARQVVAGVCRRGDCKAIAGPRCTSCAQTYWGRAADAARAAVFSSPRAAAMMPILSARTRR